MADRVKQLKIKTGVVKRLTKEKSYYEKEAEREQERYEKFKAEGSDEHVLKKQMEVINESKVMIPDTKNRLVRAKDELKSYLDTETDLSQTEEYKEACKAFDEAETLLAA